LITPPSAFLLDERVFLTLGILKVAAVLEKASVQVAMLDLSGVANYVEAVQDFLSGNDIDCFGLTATTPQMPAAYKIIQTIRAERPSARIILGGPHATLVHAAYRAEKKKKLSGRAHEAFQHLQWLVDVLVVGDGEAAVFEALKDSPPSLVNGDDPGSELFHTDKTVNELPFPARHLVDVNSYHYTIDGVRALSMIAQLGCPFGCGFCGGRLSPFLRRIRTRTSQNIVNEMVELHQTYGVTGFMLYDDELNVNREMVELMNLIDKTQKELGVEFRLRGFIKAELFTDAQAEAMYRAGFRWVLIGFESGHDRILSNINKKATRADNTRAVQIAKRHGLKVKALMSVGHPGESEETIRATHAWLLEVQPDDFDVTVITTYPGTPYFDQAVQTKPGQWTYTVPQSGDRLHALEVDYCAVAEYYKGVPGSYVSYVFTDHLTGPELVKLRDWLEADVRAQLGIPFNTSAPAVLYEHSMGQGGLPASILRSTAAAPLQESSAAI
jgi:radical SAM superfamily enzyme YgiQ (UPF0313 family)